MHAGPEAQGDGRHAAGRAVGGRSLAVRCWGVGLNPFRQARRSPAAYVMVAVAVLVCVALVVWAVAG